MWYKLTWDITSDQFDPETKQNSAVWIFPQNLPLVKCKRLWSVGNQMVVSFFGRAGHLATVSFWTGIQSMLMSTCTIVSWVSNAWHHCPQKTGLHGLMLHNDDTSAYIAAETMDFLAISGVQLVPHTLCSPDPIPCEWLLKSSCKETGLRAQKLLSENSPGQSTPEMKPCGLWCRTGGLSGWQNVWWIKRISSKKLHEYLARKSFQLKVCRKNLSDPCNSEALSWLGSELSLCTEILQFVFSSVTSLVFATGMRSWSLWLYLYTVADGTTGSFEVENARHNRAQAAHDYLQLARVSRMEWPANSPKLNPIDHIWDVGHKLKDNHPPHSNQVV